MDPLTSISIVLLAMLAGIYLKQGLGTTLLYGVILTSALFGGLSSLPADTVEALTSWETISLILLVYLVFFLNNLLSATGAMKKVVESIENMITDPRAIMALIPAIIGLMPVLSGAVISAPFADELGKKTGTNKEKRHVVNYWFRHISEYVNPVYPGVLLATGMLGLSFTTFLKANLPVMAFYALIGVAYLLYTIKKPKTRPKSLRTKDLTVVASGVAPIAVAVLLPVLLNIELYLSISAAVAVAYALNPKAKKNTKKIAAESLKPDLTAIVCLVMLFKTVLTNTQATTKISASLLTAGIPATALLIILPMMMGFLTGLTIGYVGLTFPLIMPLLIVGGEPQLHAITLAYVSGYVGLLASPIHLCFSVTQKYFNADTRGIYRMLLPPLFLTFIWALLYATVL